MCLLLVEALDLGIVPSQFLRQPGNFRFAPRDQAAPQDGSQVSEGIRSMGSDGSARTMRNTPSRALLTLSKQCFRLGLQTRGTVEVGRDDGQSVGRTDRCFVKLIDFRAASDICRKSPEALDFLVDYLLRFGGEDSSDQFLIVARVGF